MCDEIWKVISWNDNYSVSNYGKVKNNQSGSILLLKPHVSGYVKSRIGSGKNKKLISLHRLVAECFIPNPENKPTVNHKNGDKSDNRVENLEWATYKEQNLHKNIGRDKSKDYLVSSRAVWRCDKNTGKRLEFYETIKIAAEWVSRTIPHGHTSTLKGIRSKICAVARKIVEKYRDGKLPRQQTRGITKQCNRWIVQSNVNGINKYIGCFKSFEEASKAKEEAEIKFYGYKRKDKQKNVRTSAYGFRWEYEQNGIESLRGEIWKDLTCIKEVTGYKISNFGRVINRTGKLNKPIRHHSVYPWITIVKCYLIHILVAKEFVPNPCNKPMVNHIDGDKNNYHASNLEWVTCQENCIHASSP